MSDVKAPPDWYTKYLGRGFKLIQYEPKKKGPEGPDAKNWPKRFLDKPEQYVEGKNYGALLGTEVEPGRFLVDIDFDWGDGLPLARKLLPKTNFGFGRGDKTITHAFYTAPTPLLSKRFDDISGKTLVELRCAKKDGSLGLQTMLPPSVHPTGEPIELRIDGDIPHAEDIERRATLYAVASLLLFHLGAKGLNHDVRLALAGFLLQEGVEEPEVVAVGQAIAEATGNDVADVAVTVSTTVSKLKGREPVKAKATLLRALGSSGELILARIREWLSSGDELSRAVAELNKRFGIVSVGNKVVVMETEADGSIRQLWSFDEFRRLQIKNRIQQGRKTVAVADVWLSHPQGRRHNRLVYAMPGGLERPDVDDYNGWLGFTVNPLAGDWSRNNEHLHRIICAGHDDIYSWLFNWMAALVQWPGRHAFTAVALRGGQGTGKGHFAHQMLGALFHRQQYLHVIGAGMLTGRFNEHLSGKVLVFADESTWGGDPLAADKLKGMVTESTIPIERKFLPLVEEPSALHIVIASNNEWPISIAMDDRRFLVLDVVESQRQSDAYFTPLRAELAAGGLAAMLHDLLAHEVNESLLRHPPSTTGKQEVMLASLKPIQRWWFEKLLQGALDVVVTAVDSDGHSTTKVLDGWPREIRKDVLHEDYVQYLNRHKDSRARIATQMELGAFLRKFTRGNEQRRLFEGARQRVWELPPLNECRAQWARVCQWPEDFKWEE